MHTEMKGVRRKEMSQAKRTTGSAAVIWEQVEFLSYQKSAETLKLRLENDGLKAGDRD